MPRPTQVPVRATVLEAWTLLRANLRPIMMPLFVITVPAALLSGIVLTVSYLTVFSDQPILLLGDITKETDTLLAFTVVAAAGFEFLFGLVARGATVVAVAEAEAGRACSLAAALDPAFTRMGAIIAQAIVLAALYSALAITVIGLFLLPYLAARVGLGVEAMMLEKRSPTAGIMASWSLTRGRVWRFIAVVLLAACVCLAPLVVILGLDFATVGSRNEQVVIGAIVAVVQAILLAPVFAFLTTVTTLFYLRAKEIDGGQRTA